MPVFRSFALFLAVLLVSIGSLYAQKGGKSLGKKDLQKMYSSYLTDQGYRPEVDDDGDIRFMSEGKTYFIAVDEEDTECFRLVLANIWEIESEEERQRVYVAMDHCNATAKVAKAYMVRDNVWVGIESFIAEPKDFELIFKRSMSALGHGVALYVGKMREEGE